MITEIIKTIRLYPRTILSQIIKWMEDKQAIVLVGSRQVGKTSILYLLIQHLVSQRTNPCNIFYFDLENFDHMNLIEKGPESLIQFLNLEGADFGSLIYVFIDEIQYLTDPSKFLKLMVDHHSQISPDSGVKIICTGSSTLDIRRKFRDSLVGRKIVFDIFSLSFEEFLKFKRKEDLFNSVEKYNLSSIIKTENLPPNLPDIYINSLQNQFNEYCQYGGYPAVVLEPNLKKKLDLLSEIHSSYVLKDLSSLFTIENINAFNQLIQLLALGMSNLLNINTLTTDLAISRQTLENYLIILENTFIIKRLVPFFRRKKREVIKMPKLFFLDLGLRNLMVKQFGELNLRPDRGSLVENFTFIHLYRQLGVLNELNFWRTKNGTEVDFILSINSPNTSNNQLIPVEVKHQTFNKLTVPSGLKSFLTVYPSSQAVVITKETCGQVKTDSTTIFFVPAWLMGTVTFVEKQLK